MSWYLKRKMVNSYSKYTPKWHYLCTDNIWRKITLINGDVIRAFENRAQAESRAKRDKADRKFNYIVVKRVE